MLCRSITYVIFSFLSELTKFLFFFLLRYIGCNKARNKARRYQPDEEIIDETDFWFYTQPCAVIPTKSDCPIVFPSH